MHARNISLTELHARRERKEGREGPGFDYSAFVDGLAVSRLEFGLVMEKLWKLYPLPI